VAYCTISEDIHMEKEMALIGEAQVVTLAGKKFPVASQN
jgi:hypothetical protein